MQGLGVLPFAIPTGYLKANGELAGLLKFEINAVLNGFRIPLTKTKQVKEN